MAESGCPAPETLPLEVTSSPALGTDTSKSPTSVGGSTPQQEEQHKSSSSISVCLGSKQDEGHSETSTPELAAHRNGVRPHSNAEMCSFQWAGSPGGTVDRRPCADEVCSAVWKENHVASCKQSMQRSHSDNPHVAREASGPWVRETGFPCQWVNFCSQKTSGCPSLVCKQAVELQRSNTVTVCQCGSGSTRPLGGVRICVPSPEEVDTAHDGCREACYGPHAHACSLGDACAAYCHHLPIPAPMPLPPRLVDAERGGQRAPHHHADRLAFPRLVTSISETGLDAKSVTCCCGGDCVERGTPQPREGRRIRDVGTMTSRWELKDVGVQAGHPRSATPPHVFPEVSLMEETETGRPATQKSPVREVAWDAEGMTWEVYGASVDPEELGLAIQKHLELQIKETASRASRLARQDTTSSQQSGRHRKRGGSVIRSLGNPACCVRSSTTVD